jgi:hypothetical protein
MRRFRFQVWLGPERMMHEFRFERDFETGGLIAILDMPGGMRI